MYIVRVACVIAVTLFQTAIAGHYAVIIGQSSLWAILAFCL